MERQGRAPTPGPAACGHILESSLKLEKLLSLSVSQFPHLQNRHIKSTYLPGPV